MVINKGFGELDRNSYETKYNEILMKLKILLSVLTILINFNAFSVGECEEKIQNHHRESLTSVISDSDLGKVAKEVALKIIENKTITIKFDGTKNDPTVTINNLASIKEVITQEDYNKIEKLFRVYAFTNGKILKYLPLVFVPNDIQCSNYNRLNEDETSQCFDQYLSGEIPIEGKPQDLLDLMAEIFKQKEINLVIMDWRYDETLKELTAEAELFIDGKIAPEEVKQSIRWVLRDNTEDYFEGSGHIFIQEEIQNLDGILTASFEFLGNQVQAQVSVKQESPSLRVIALEQDDTNLYFKANLYENGSDVSNANENILNATEWIVVDQKGTSLKHSSEGSKLTVPKSSIGEIPLLSVKGSISEPFILKDELNLRIKSQPMQLKELSRKEEGELIIVTYSVQPNYRIEGLKITHEVIEKEGEESPIESNEIKESVLTLKIKKSVKNVKIKVSFELNEKSTSGEFEFNSFSNKLALSSVFKINKKRDGGTCKLSIDRNGSPNDVLLENESLKWSSSSEEIKCDDNTWSCDIKFSDDFAGDNVKIRLFKGNNTIASTTCKAKDVKKECDFEITASYGEMASLEIDASEDLQKSVKWSFNPSYTSGYCTKKKKGKLDCKRSAYYTRLVTASVECNGKTLEETIELELKEKVVKERPAKWVCPWTGLTAEAGEGWCPPMVLPPASNYFTPGFM
jgi:hypothetical protein